MLMRSLGHIARLNLLMGAALGLVVVATWAGATVQDSETQLSQRVSEYWKYKIERNFEKSYAYETPQYRERVPLSEYKQSLGKGVKWLDFQVEKVAVENDAAKVHVKIRYKWTMVSAGPKDGFTGTAAEDWCRVDGTWYHVYKQKQKMIPPKHVGSERR